MSITRTDRVTCRCGTPVEVFVADSLNAGRHPHLKDALIQRTLHRFQCAVCDQILIIEKDMLFFDFERRQFFCMYPRHERAREAELAAEVKRAYNHWLLEAAPVFIRQQGREFLMRCCFGYEELREKVVIDDLRLSDLVIEALKLEIMRADPWFEQAEVLTLRLETMSPDGSLQFIPEWLDGPHEAKVITVKRELYDALDAKFDEILRTQPALAGGAHVSMLRIVDWPVSPPLGRSHR